VATHVTISSKTRLCKSIDPNPKRKNENPKMNRNAFKYFGEKITNMQQHTSPPKKHGYISIIRRIIKNGAKPDHQIKYQESTHQDIKNPEFPLCGL